MKHAPHEGEAINLHKLPDGSFGTRARDEDLHIDAEDLRSRLDEALNPPQEKGDLADKPRSNVIYHDFSQVPKPTNIEVETDKTSEKHSENHKAHSKKVPVKAVPEEESAESAESAETAEDLGEDGHFNVPEELVEYVSTLVSEGRPLKYLKWDLKDSIKTPGSWKKTLGTYVERGVLTEEEYNKAVKFLGDTTDKSGIPTAVDIAMKATEGYVKKNREEKPEAVPDSIPSAIDIAMRKTDKYVEKKHAARAETSGPEVSEAAQVSESAEDVERKLHDAREAYIAELADWKSKLREKKNTFHKLLAGLGVEKPLPQGEIPANVIDANEAYLKAKDAHIEVSGLAGNDHIVLKKKALEGQILNLKEFVVETNPSLAEFVEKERDLILSGLLEHSPTLESRIKEKGSKVWDKLTMGNRLTVGTSMATGVGIVFGGLGLVKAESYDGMRAAHTHDELNAKNGEAGIYSATASDMEKRQAFASATEAVRSGKHVYFDGTGGGGSGKNLEKIMTEAPEAQGGGKFIKQYYNTEILPAAQEVKSVEVPLSPKGFIQDIQTLKTKIIAEYGGKDKVPQTIQQNILNKTNINLAKEFHFYDPEHNLEARGYATDKLSLDSRGNLVLTRADGSKDVIINANTGEGDGYSGKMFEMKHKAKSAKIENAEEVKAEAPKPIPMIGDKFDPKLGLPGTEAPKLSSDHVIYSTGQLNLIRKDGKESMLYDNTEIAHEKDGLWVLDDKYQKGPEHNEIRQAFSYAFEQNSDKIHKHLPHATFAFENGYIHAVSGLHGDGKEVSVLLNGREIAKGEISAKGIQHLKMLKEPGLSGGLFARDTVYERALQMVKDYARAESVVKALLGPDGADKTEHAAVKDIPSQPEKTEVAAAKPVATASSSEKISSEANGMEKPLDLPANYEQHKLDFTYKNGVKLAMYDNLEIAHETGGILVLENRFQDGPENSLIRKVFSFAAYNNKDESHMGKTNIAFPFEDGRVHIVLGLDTGPNDMKLLLNGKEFATGEMTDKWPKLTLNNASGIKGGWLLSDTPYERAFKKAKDFLKKPENLEALRTK